MQGYFSKGYDYGEKADLSKLLESKKKNVGNYTFFIGN